jgi:hypothetical protein
MTTTASARYCMARQPYVYDPLACTMDAGHDGPVHVAHGNAGRVLATWPTAATVYGAMPLTVRLRALARSGMAELDELLLNEAADRIAFLEGALKGLVPSGDERRTRLGLD